MCCLDDGSGYAKGALLETLRKADMYTECLSRNVTLLFDSVTNVQVTTGPVVLDCAFDEF